MQRSDESRCRDYFRRCFNVVVILGFTGLSIVIMVALLTGSLLLFNWMMGQADVNGFLRFLLNFSIVTYSTFATLCLLVVSFRGAFNVALGR